MKSKSVASCVSHIVKMEDIHEHLPTPDDIRTILYVLEEGQLVRVGPELYPRILCLLPDCHLNRRNLQSQDNQDDKRPAHTLPESQGGGGDTTSTSGTHLTLLSFPLSLSSTLSFSSLSHSLSHLFHVLFFSLVSNIKNSIDRKCKASSSGALSPRAVWSTTNGES